MSAPSPTTAPTAAPAAASPTTVVVPANAPAPETSTPAVEAAQPSRKRRISEKLLGKKRTDDLETGLKSDDEGFKRKRRLFGLGVIGTILTILVILFMTLLTTGAGFVIASYIFPMLTCRLHGYKSQCMFNDWDKSGISFGEWFSEHLPHAFGGGFHDSDW